MVDLWTSFDELAAHNFQRGNTYIFCRYFNSEGALR
jgi:hypothetical protein